MPLLAAVKAHKRAALDYLSAPAPPEHVQVCAECGAQRVETCPDFSPERTACEKNPAGAIGCQMQPAPAPTCSRCRVFELNPYTHYPDFDGWCWAEMDNAESTAPVCDAYYAGAVKDLRTGQVMDPRPQAPSKRRSLCYH
jgi:hypothetical protein